MADLHEDAPASPPAADRYAGVVSALYPWPPSYAFHRSCMLEAYAAAAVHDLPGPVIDVGCGDGRFATALIACGLVDELAAAVDRDPDDLRHAPLAVRTQGVAGDLLALPLARDCAGTVMCNTVLNCLSTGLGDLDVALSEVSRLLRPGGHLVCCVHTSTLAELHLGYRLLSALGLRRWAARYLDAIHRSNGRTIHLSAEQWAGRLGAAGFTIERTIHFFTAEDASLRRRLRLLRYVPSRALARRVRDRLTLRHRRRDAGASAPSGYVLIVARKPEMTRDE
jgi:SAM-dependent methyltransferase